MLVAKSITATSAAGKVLLATSPASAASSLSVIPIRFAEAVWLCSHMWHRLTIDVRRNTNSFKRAPTEPLCAHIASCNAA